MALSKAQQMKMLELYRQGEKTDAIAARFGVDTSYPGKLARRHGIPSRRRGSIRVDAATRAAVFADYCAGKLNVREIAIKHGVSESFPSRLTREIDGPRRYNSKRTEA